MLDIIVCKIFDFYKTSFVLILSKKIIKTLFAGTVYHGDRKMGPFAGHRTTE